jgi:hypothetical protein
MNALPEIIEAEDDAPIAAIDVTDASLAVGLTRAEIDTQIATARKFPRHLKAVQTRLHSYVTLDHETAEESIYALPRGGKPIKGPSIRFAEALKASFGNCRAAARVVHVDRAEKVVIAQGVFHDLETNSASSAEVRRRIVDKRGRIYNEDMINTTGNAACAIAMRNAILGGIPKAVWRAAYEAVNKIVTGDVATLSVTRDKAVKALAAFGATPEQVYAALGIEGADEVTVEHIPILRGMYSALKSGEATAEEMFSRVTTEPAHTVVSNPLSDDEPTVTAAEDAPKETPSKNEKQPATPPDSLVEYDKALVGCKTEAAHAAVLEMFKPRVNALEPKQKKVADSIAARHLERVKGA